MSVTNTNLKMENCGLRSIGDDGRYNDPRDALSDFCRYACFQIELLLNIYFKKKYQTFAGLRATVDRLITENKIGQGYRINSYNNSYLRLLFLKKGIT